LNQAGKRILCFRELDKLVIRVSDGTMMNTDHRELRSLYVIALLVATAWYGGCAENHRLGAGNAGSAAESLRAEVSGTFSIVAVDPNTGVCGAAVASKYPAVGKVVPYVRGGVGAFCTQHWHNPEWGPRALDLLAAGYLPEQVLAELLRDDPRRDKRQLAIIDMTGRAANRNCANADTSGVWWGSVAGRYYACQGNTLAGQEVVFAMARAYEQTPGSLADRLMAALVAGDHAGGDHRGRLAAGIRIAKAGVAGCWLELYVDESNDAVTELAAKYAALEHEAKGTPGGKSAPADSSPGGTQTPKQ
jgi:uncharacterized Ntn-hydrolase superfamily protein